MGKAPQYSRREREIMDVLHRLDGASARQVLEALDDPPSYSAVRATLRIMVDKGYLVADASGPAHTYRPKVTPKRARLAAVRHLVDTFFDGCTEQAVSTLLDAGAKKLRDEELDRLQALIDRARRGEPS